jgi:hypothetical protein
MLEEKRVLGRPVFSAALKVLVILSGVSVSRSEADTESKDPYTLPRIDSGYHYVPRKAQGPSTPQKLTS